MILFRKHSVVKCPVCGCKGKNLVDVEEDREIACRSCQARTRATRWTECDWQPLPLEMETAKIRKELEDAARYIKGLAEAIDMPMEEVVKMIQE